MIICSSGNILLQYDGFNSGFHTSGCTVGIENSDGTDGLQVAFNTTYLHDDLAILLSRKPKWITEVSPASGKIASGDSIAIEVAFSATNMIGGEYWDSLEVSSNDCYTPDTLVPVYLHVAGAAAIVLSENSIDYGEVFVGYPVTEAVTVSNEGTDSLFVSSIVIQGPDYEVDSTGFSLDVGESQDIAVTFTPTTDGLIAGSLTINSNDPDDPAVSVALMGEGIIPPEIAIRPDSIVDTLMVGDTTTQTLTIDNTQGGSDLLFEILVESAAATDVRLNAAYRQPSYEFTGIPEDARYAPGRVIVKLVDGARRSEVRELKRALDAQVLRKFRLIDAELWSISGITVEEAVNTYYGDSRIEYIEPDYECELDGIPNDPRFDQLWGMHNVGQTGGTDDADIDAPEAWDYETGGSIVIGVIDTGVDPDHEDLADNMWVNEDEIPGNGVDDDSNGYVDDTWGWDFVHDHNNPFDDYGHGTHCAGTIAGVGNNGMGVAGVCWNAKIMAVKWITSFGFGHLSDAISSVEYATVNGANLTSNSWHKGPYSQALYDAIAAAGAANQLFVASAGNDDWDRVSLSFSSSNHSHRGRPPFLPEG